MTKIAGVYIQSEPEILRAGATRSFALRLSRAARRAVRRTLRSRRSIRLRVGALAIDHAGNSTPKRRTVTLRR